jgi:hypothetical protein
MDSTNNKCSCWIKNLQIFRESVHDSAHRCHIKECVDRSFHDWVKDSWVNGLQSSGDNSFDAVLSDAVYKSDSYNHKSDFSEFVPELELLVFSRWVCPVTNKIVILNNKGVTWCNHEKDDQELNPMSIEVGHDILIVFEGNFNHFIFLVLNDSSIILVFLGSEFFEKIFTYYIF